MKKRSLFAAVAMLIVSAIVLTSATYAWFAKGTDVNVAKVEAEISNSDGSILISADNTNWGSTVTYEQLAGQSGNSLTTAFTPISVNPSTFNLAGGSITSGQFAPETAASGRYIGYTVYIKSDVAVKATINPTFDFANTAFIYGMVKVGDDYTVRNLSTANKYFPVLATSGANIPDANGNSILDDATHDGKGACGLGSPSTWDEIPEGTLGEVVTPDTNTLTVDLTPGASVAINVLMWAEGQHPACCGTVERATPSAALMISKVASGS